MEVITKYDIGDDVWFVTDNKVQNLGITGVSILSVEDGETTIEYTLHYDIIINENDVFETKDKLLNSLQEYGETI